MSQEGHINLPKTGSLRVDRKVSDRYGFETDVGKLLARSPVGISRGGGKGEKPNVSHGKEVLRILAKIDSRSRNHSVY